MHNIIEQFRNEILTSGLEPPIIIEPGKFHRFPGYGKGISNKSAWCRLFPDMLGGIFGDFSSGLSKIWYTNRSNLSILEQNDLVKKSAKMREDARLKEERTHALAKDKATRIWMISDLAPNNHLYFYRKKMKTYGLKLYKGDLVINGMPCDGSIIVPIRHKDEICSLQFINPEGCKRFLPGGRILGCYYVLGSNELPTDGCLFVTEGLATAATINEETDYPVAVSFYSGNLNEVTQNLIRVLPASVELIIACDNDRHNKDNPGLTYGRKAAVNAGISFVWPDFPCTNCECSDFNDLKRCFLKNKDGLNEKLK